MTESRFRDTESGYKIDNYVIDLDRMIIIYKGNRSKGQWNIRINHDGDIEYQHTEAPYHWARKIDPSLQDRARITNWLAEKELLREE